MTAQQAADRIKQLAHEAHQSGNQREFEILELIAQGIERDHSDIMLRLLRGIRDAYNAGRTDQMKVSQGG